jgi:long-subunit fatty acid transport protein
LNSHFVDFTKSSSFYESNTNNLGTNYTVRELRFNNDLYTYGTGFSFQIGAIAKVTNEVRLGLAYESPTWYRLSDEFSQSLTAMSKNISGELPTDVVNPNVINYYAPYKLQTPGKVTGSFAYVFGKRGLISIDYALKNYGNTKFKPESDSYFGDLNSQMSNTLASTGELRIGAEYKIKALSIRAGYRFEESPYKNSQTIGDFNSYSGGLGYNFGVCKLDVAYAYGERTSQQGFFNQGLTDVAKTNTKNNNAVVTLSFEL